jgi:two-component system sensor histidine kinase CpxA
MRSLYGRIALWFGLCFVLAGTGFVLIAVGGAQGQLHGVGGPGLLLRGYHRMAVAAYRSKGVEGLRDHLDQLADTGIRYRLLDQNGTDMVTGEHITALPEWMPLTGLTLDGYRLVVQGPQQFDPYKLTPYFALPLLIVLVAGLAFSLSLARPLRALERSVLRFGGGDLSSRAPSDRDDEIGRVGLAFNSMAARVENLLTTERRLMQDVAHELRGPLARLTLAIDAQHLNPDRNAAKGHLKSEVRRLTALVSELLHMVEAEGDPGERISEELDLARLMECVVSDCRIEFEDKGCRPQWVTAGPALIVGDWELLRRAVENVLRNAIRYAPPGTPVEIRMERRHRTLITIRDHGPGVSVDCLPMIFRPFYRVEAYRGHQSDGSGLGLSIAQRAVALHHGRIWAERAEPGLLVSIELPNSSR